MEICSSFYRDYHRYSEELWVWNWRERWHHYQTGGKGWMVRINLYTDLWLWWAIKLHNSLLSFEIFPGVLFFKQITFQRKNSGSCILFG